MILVSGCTTHLSKNAASQSACDLVVIRGLVTGFDQATIEMYTLMIITALELRAAKAKQRWQYAAATRLLVYFGQRHAPRLEKSCRHDNCANIYAKAYILLAVF